VSTIHAHQFVSGADEKLLRVFDQPKDVAELLSKLCGIQKPKDAQLPDTAAMPVLGLSNKAMGDEDQGTTELGHAQEYVVFDGLDASIASITEPPTEDLLSRHTLWPEYEKLYGHGYEISGCSYSPHIELLATACKASSTDHAVIRLYDVQTWNEIKPPLAAHSLTITRMRWFNTPYPLLISVGRDRQWAIFHQPESEKPLQLAQINAKAHTRMILDAACSPIGDIPFFATAGRDKTIKIWYHSKHDNSKSSTPAFSELTAIKLESAVTALDFTCDSNGVFAVLAAGEESGKVSIHVFRTVPELLHVLSIDVPTEHCPSKAISQLAWRPNSQERMADDQRSQLAIAAADSSVRIINVNAEELCKEL
jgi:elongator complex protein 2